MQRQVVDLGSGSGAIAFAIATECDAVDVVGLEVDPAAQTWARRNLARVIGPAGERDSTVLLRDGDIITIDANKGTIDCNVSAEEFAKRKAAWKPRETHFGSGALWKYAQQVGPAVNGAVTHPGGNAETSCYADS